MILKLKAFFLGILAVLFFLAIFEFACFIGLIYKKNKIEADAVFLQPYVSLASKDNYSLLSWADKLKAGLVREPVCESRLYKNSFGDNNNKALCSRFERSDWVFNGVFNRMRENNAKAHSCYKLSGKVLFDVSFHTDSFGRRVSANSNKKHEKFMIFLGNSFVFGHGVNDHETLPSQLSRFLPDYAMYNYGVPGNSVGSTLAQAQATNFAKEINEGQGIVLYLFFDFDIHKLIPTFQNGRIPMMDQQVSLVEDAAGDIVTVPPIGWKHKLRFIIYSILDHSNIVEFFNIDFPLPDETDLRLYAKAIKAMKLKIESEKKVEKFIVVGYPGNGIYFPQVKKLLTQEGVSVIDFTQIRLDRIMPTNPFFPCDNHPTADTHKLIAGLLNKAIFNKN